MIAGEVAALRPTGTVARVSELIRYLAEQDGEVAVTTVARDLSLPASTAHRLLHLLMDQGFVERGERFQSYRVGGELYRLGCLVSRKIGLADLADPIMRGLSADLGEFSMLTLYLTSEHKLTLVHTVAAPNPLTYRPELFSQLSIAWGASGRAILASLCENEICTIYLKSGPSPVTGAALPPYPVFREELRLVASRGYSRTNAQRMAGAVGMASPVRNAAGEAGRQPVSDDFRVPLRSGARGRTWRDVARARRGVEPCKRGRPGTRLALAVAGVPLVDQDVAAACQHSPIDGHLRLVDHAFQPQPRIACTAQRDRVADADMRPRRISSCRCASARGVTRGLSPIAISAGQL